MGTSTRRRFVSVPLAALAVAGIASTVPATAAPPPGVHRLVGDFTADAAAEIARFAFSESGSETALLARQDLFADSLAAGGAQGMLQAPLLLTSTSELDIVTREVMDDLGVRRVIVLGGTSAVSESVADELRASGRQVERIAGADRVETAALIAEQLFPDSSNPRPLVARARGAKTIDKTSSFADALSGGVLAAQLRSPVLLTETAALSPATRDYLVEAEPDAKLAIVAGGTAAVSESTAAEIRSLGWEVERRSGVDRFETAIALNGFAGVTAADVSTVVLLDGTHEKGWAPGFAAAGLAAVRNADGLVASVLSDGDELPAATRSWLADTDTTRPPVLVCAPFVAQAACDAVAVELGYDASAGR